MHLKRAYGFLKEVEDATESFRQQAVSHTKETEADQPFLQGMVSTVRGSKQLHQQKAALVNDLQLADQEIDCAVRLDSEASIQTKDGSLSAIGLRSTIAFMNGQLEMIWGNNERAKGFFDSSIQILELPDAHYMLGLLFESEYKPADALRHFEKCLELDPAGEFSVGALREASAMKKYKPCFRGSWGTFLILFLFFFPGAFLYFFLKRK